MHALGSFVHMLTVTRHPIVARLSVIMILLGPLIPIVGIIHYAWHPESGVFWFGYVTGSTLAIALVVEWSLRRYKRSLDRDNMEEVL